MSSYHFDFLVVGSGIAGLTFALKVAEYGTVGIITKKADSDSSTNYAQGGIALAISSNDSFDMHVQDTLNAGAGLCHIDAVRTMVSEGPNYLKELLDFGVKFTRVGKGKRSEFHLGREGGHSRNRIVHAKDLTGRAIEEALLKKIKECSNITLFENHIAVELITEHHLGGTFPADSRKIHCWGVYVFNAKQKKVEIFASPIIMLTTGGSGHVYLHTTNPSIATGDGIAMMYRAGGKIGNLEFMQFHPTTFYNPGFPPFLISEAVRGAGAILRNSRGEDFMKKTHPMGSLAPRDIVARTIDMEMKKTGEPNVYLDLGKIPAKDIKKNFPNIYKTCLLYKLDITKEPIPVVPAAHYMCGGIVTDLYGHTNIENLYAC